MNRAELLAPAGNFDSAAAALENGADAVYCGLQEFSARKSAKNFTLDQISRLRSWTGRESKKIYMTLNTILKEDELPRLLTYLCRLEEIGVDSIILQDPGLARIVKQHFPGLVLHGSTQMAIHNLSGLKVLREAGFSRVVLPREMTMEEISGFRESLPEMELEVFIHGAQCYGFSGMCLASGLLLGRSANRGECGQICRTWFESRGERGYFLSSTDLWAGQNVLELEKAGVSSLKIEGRMKSPAYAAAVSRYYRAVLDGTPDEKLKDLEEDLRITFSRNSGTGHFESARGQNMVDSEFPGHRGLFLGTSSGESKSGIQLKTPVPLHKRDGLMYLDHKGEAHSFSLETKGGATLNQGMVTIPFSGKAPPAGTRFFKIQSHDNHMKMLNEMAYPLSRREIAGRITLSSDSLTLEIPELGYSGTFPCPSEAARGKGNLEEKILSEFQKSSDYSFVLTPLKLTGNGISIGKRFIPPSVLKKMRQEAYKNLDVLRRSRESERISKIAAQLEEDAERLAKRKTELPPRELLNPAKERIPFLTPGNINRVEPVKIEGRTVLPLSPLIFPRDEESYMESLVRRISRGVASVGINNWGHILMYRALKKQDPSLSWYGDTGMLLANSQALLFLEELTGEACGGAYGWVESDEREISQIFTPPGKKYSPPLFISRNCFRKHSLKESCRNCGQSFGYTIKQKNRDFKVLVQECLTWIFATGQD